MRLLLLLLLLCVLEVKLHHGPCTLPLQRCATGSPPHPPGLLPLAATDTSLGPRIRQPPHPPGLLPLAATDTSLGPRIRQPPHPPGLLPLAATDTSLGPRIRQPPTSCGEQLLFVGCLTSQQHACVSQGWICSNFTCCHIETEVADQTFHLTLSQYTDTRPTSPSTDPIKTPGAWQGSHWSANS